MPHFFVRLTQGVSVYYHLLNANSSLMPTLFGAPIQQALKYKTFINFKSGKQWYVRIKQVPA